jgi:hypothetical protein
MEKRWRRNERFIENRRFARGGVCIWFWSAFEVTKTSNLSPVFGSC